MYKRKFHIILLLILTVILCFTVASCSKPAGEGGVNNNNIGKDSIIDSNLNSYIENNSELINNLLVNNGYQNSSLKVIDVSNYETLYSYVDKKYDSSDESLTDIEKEKIQEKNRSMKKNIKSIFERRGIKSLYIDTGHSIIPEYSIFSSAANFFESYCEYILAIQDPFYTDDLNSNLANAQNKYKTICINYNEYILNFNDSKIMDSLVSMFKLIDAVESRGEFDFIKNSNILLNYNGNDSTVIIPENVEQIQSYAFANRQDIEEIVFTKDVPIINRNAFDHILNLKVSVKDNNDFYLSSDQSYQLFKSNSEFIRFNSKYGITGDYQLVSVYDNESDNYVYDLAEVYYSVHQVWDEKNSEYTYVDSKDIFNKRLENMGYKNAKISFAYRNNTYFFDKYVNKFFEDKNLTQEQISKLQKLYNDLFFKYNMSVMVVVQNGEPVDIIDDLCSIYKKMEDLTLSEKQAAFAFHESFKNPDININSTTFIDEFNNYKYYVNIFVHWGSKIINVYSGNNSYLEIYSKMFGNSSHHPSSAEFCDEAGNHYNGLIRVEPTYDKSYVEIYSNCSIIFDGAFKDNDKVTHISIQNPSIYIGHDLFNDKKDLLISTPNNKENVSFEFADDWNLNKGHAVGILYGFDINEQDFKYDCIDIYKDKVLVQPTFDSTYFDLATSNKDKAISKASELGLDIEIKINAINHSDNTNISLPKWTIFEWNMYSYNDKYNYAYKFYLSKLYDLTVISFGTYMHNDINIIYSNLDNNALTHFIHESRYNDEEYDAWYQGMISRNKLIENNDCLIIIRPDYYNDISNYLTIKDILLNAQ